MADTKIGNISVYEDDDGKAVWEFEGKVQSDIPLDTEAQNFAEAINELKKLSEQGGGEGGADIFKIIGSENSLAAVQIDNRSLNSESLTNHNFIFAVRGYSSTTKVETSAAVKYKTRVKKIIVGVSYKNEKILEIKTDKNGTITAAFDRMGNDIINGVNGSAANKTDCFEGVAVGWALAYNKVTESEYEKRKKQYEKDVEDTADPDDLPNFSDIENSDKENNVDWQNCFETKQVGYYASEGISKILLYSRGEPQYSSSISNSGWDVSRVMIKYFYNDGRVETDYTAQWQRIYDWVDGNNPNAVLWDKID